MKHGNIIVATVCVQLVSGTDSPSTRLDVCWMRHLACLLARLIFNYYFLTNKLWTRHAQKTFMILELLMGVKL